MDINTNINKLKYFQTVCKYNNITKAAEELHIAQPSISTAIKSLERELGLSLFSRKHNKLNLTEEGKHVLELTNVLLQDIDNFFDEILDIGKNPDVPVRIGSVPILGSNVIPKIYSTLSKNLPKIKYVILEFSTEDIFKNLDEYTIDLGVAIDYNAREEYHSRPLYKTSIHFCVSKESPLAGKKYITCDDVKDYPLVLVSPGNYQHYIVMEMFKKRGIQPNIILYSTQLPTILHLIQNRNVGTFLFKDAFPDNPDILTIPCSLGQEVVLSIFWRKDRYVTPACKSVIETLALV